MSFSLTGKALHFSTADLSTLNERLHAATLSPFTHGGNGHGEANSARGRAKPKLALAWAGLAAGGFTALSLPLLPASQQTPVGSTGFCRAQWAGAGLSYPMNRYLMPWSSPATIFPGALLWGAAGGPSGAGAQVSGGSRSDTLHLGKTGGEERCLDPQQDASHPRGLHMMCQRRWQVGHWSCHLCCWVSTGPGRGQISLR